MATYAIHNTVRSTANRALRASLPVHHRLKHHIGDGQRRLIRGRPIFMEEEEFLRNLPELKEKAAVGILEVRTPEGLLIDLETLKPEVAPALPAEPHPRLDSIAHDVPWGQKIPPMPGDELPSEGATEPSLLLGNEGAEEEEPDPHSAEDSTEPTPRPARSGKAKVMLGVIEVRTPQGHLVDLESLAPPPLVPDDPSKEGSTEPSLLSEITDPEEEEGAWPSESPPTGHAHSPPPKGHRKGKR